MLFYYLLSVVSLVLLGYVLLVRFFTRHYVFSDDRKGEAPNIPVSIIIPARNEERSLAICLQSIANQAYDPDLIEIIVVDDHSEDTTVQTVAIFADHYKNIQIHILSSADSGHFGKKNGIETGVKCAKNALIFQLDADVELAKNTLSRMAGYFTEKKLRLLFAPLRFRSGSSFFSKWMALEFLTLTSSGAACLQARQPLMGNAACMMYDKECYLEYLQSRIGKQYASGDDMFFMQYIEKERSVAEILSLIDPEATVLTDPPADLRAFFRQRIRWAGKTGGYVTLFPKMVALIVFFVSITAIGVLFSAFFSIRSLMVAFLFFGIKTLFEGLFLRKVIRLNNRNLKEGTPLFINSRVSTMLALALFHPFYVVSVAFLSFFCKPDWKGRRVSSFF